MAREARVDPLGTAIPSGPFAVAGAVTKGIDTVEGAVVVEAAAASVEAGVETITAATRAADAAAAPASAVSVEFVDRRDRVVVRFVVRSVSAAASIGRALMSWLGIFTRTTR